MGSTICYSQTCPDGHLCNRHQPMVPQKPDTDTHLCFFSVHIKEVPLYYYKLCKSCIGLGLVEDSGLDLTLSNDKLSYVSKMFYFTNIVVFYCTLKRYYGV